MKDTPKRILDAARNLFLEKGKNGVGTKDIASGADVNKAMIHYYFETKENLYREVCRKVVDDCFLNANEILEEPMDLLDKLRAYINQLVDAVDENTGLHRFLISEYNAGEKMIRTLINEKFQQDMPSFRKQLKQAADNYEIARVPAEQLLLYIHALVLYPFAMEGLYPAESSSLPEATAHDRASIAYDIILSWLTN